MKAQETVISGAPAISVHVPLYNCMKYLRKCLESISAQTFDDFEVICVDDGSSDGSAEFVEHWAQSDSRFKVIRHDENQGVGCARNTALMNSSGLYIVSVDSDDFAKPHMLDRLWRASNAGYFDIVSFGFVSIYEDGGIHDIYQPTERIQEFFDGSRVILAEVMFWNKLIKRSLFVNHDIKFPERLLYEDLSSMARLLSVSKRIRSISDVLYCYRYQRKGSLINTINGKQITDYADVYKLLFDWFKLRCDDTIPQELFTQLDHDMKFMGGKILGSTMDTEEIKEHLKQLLLLKISFLENREGISKLGSIQLLEQIKYNRYARIIP